ncbi:peptidase caspase catalytic subunit p20, putative, partial [Ichthyophthirius multifiliis]
MILKIHKNIITCVEELSFQSELVASSSLDCTIKIWSIQNGTLIREIECKRGVLKISNQNQTLISCGFSHYVNIWNPEISGKIPLLGKLRGHNNLVIFCSFLGNTFNGISLDQDNNIKIWNIKKMQLIQNIDNLQKIDIKSIFYYQKQDRIFIGGKKLIFLERKIIKKNNNMEYIYPIDIDFNVYFNTILILT